MTMSTTVDVSDSLDEARTRLLKTARALNGAWAAAFCSMVLLTVASVVLLLVAVTMRPVYVVIWSVLLAATGYNVTRFWPRRRARPGHRLAAHEAAALRAAVDPDGRLAWPDVVRLVPRAELELGEGELVLGMPLLACLDPEELRQLLVTAALQTSVEDERAVRWALRVAHGDIGRPLVGRRPRLTWPTMRLTEELRARAAQLDADLGNWAGACERATLAASRPGADVLATRDQLAEAWALVRSEWLEPAFARGRRHVAPFTGLRQFVEGADAAGWLKSPRPWWPTTGPVAEIVAAHEEAVALALDERGTRLKPITWEQHPLEVTVPHWRALVTEVLDAARRTTYDPAVTLESVLLLMESGEGRALADTTAADRGLTWGETAAYGEWSERFVSRTLTAAIGIASVDSEQFRPRWSWPEGTRLEGHDGWLLPLDSIVAEVLGMVRDGVGLDKAYAELREALDELEIDQHEPLWLDHDTSVQPERPVGSFAARQGLGARAVVVTDRALHVFRDAQPSRALDPHRPAAPRDASVELRRRMLTVWQGDTTDQVLTLAADDVRRARLGPAIGGLWWRLTLSCADGTVVLRGRGDGLEEEAEVKEWLGERVETVWMHSHPTVRTLRNAVGLGGMTLGTLGLLWGVLLTIVRPGGMPAALPAVLALGGFAAMLVALAPDGMLQLKRRVGRARVQPLAD
ncbi:hypothetical protein [Nocardioides halotolerans]|uniref:hypothetical protein n=1 Tax=Nocardioides halotolerans TaxID=433660 RepID=UPI00040D3CB0|nr:hypothetical protein [Nocardioides halotolerans]